MSQKINAQDRYQKLWKEVETLEINNKIEDANKIVAEIKKIANRNNDEEQLIKTFFYEAKFLMVKSEESQVAVLKELDSRLKSSKFPQTNIYHSIYAQLLRQYLQSKRWQISERTAVNDTTSKDFLTWDISRFYKEIAYHYEQSIKNPDKLIKIPVSSVDILLQREPLSRAVRPSLLDLLAHTALDFYKESNSYVTIPKEHFILTPEVAFNNTNELLQLQRPKGDTIYSSYDVMKTYAFMEEQHAKAKNDAAYLHTFIERMNYGRSQLGTTVVFEEYESQLQKLIDTYKYSENVNLSLAALAQYYMDLSGNSSLENYKNYRKKAIETAQQAKSLHPESYGALQASKILSNIFQKSTNITTQSYVIPQKPIIGTIAYRNVNQVQLFIKPVAQEFVFKGKDRDSVMRAFFNKNKAAKSFTFEKSIALPASDDTYDHSFGFFLPAMPSGRYFVFYEVTSDNEPVINYHEITITNLTVVQKNLGSKLELTVLNRENGNPIEGVRVRGYRFNEFWNSDVRKESITTKKDGKFFIPLKQNEDFNDRDVYLSYKGDSLDFNVYNYRDYYRERSKANTQAKAFIYLDRAIYRPGQTLYYKAIVLKNKNEETSVIEGLEINVGVYDVNNQLVKEIKGFTNEYGSVHGEVILPQEGLTGAYRIEVSRVDSSDLVGVDSWINNSINFQVEEYKRPRFKTEFKPVTGTFKLGDTVEVIGFAKALLGSAVTDAAVSYTVVRNMRSNNWRYSYYSTQEEVITQGGTITNTDGDFTIKFKAEADPTIAKDYKPIYNYTITATVTDVNGETREASTTVYIGLQSITIDLNIPETLTAKDNSIDIAVKNLNGQPAKALVKLELRKAAEADHVIIGTNIPITEFNELNRDSFRKQFPYAPLRADEQEIMQMENWKAAPVLFTKTIQIDSTVTLSIPINKDWKNGSYIWYATTYDPNATAQNEESLIETRLEKNIWVNKEIALKPTIIDASGTIDKNEVLVTVFTSMDEVNGVVMVWDEDGMIEEKLYRFVKGKNEIRFDLKKRKGKSFNFHVNVQEENSYVNSSFKLARPQEVKESFTIETKTFRDKLYPGEKETWSFTIKDSKKTAMQAEVLASMYDTSIDAFATSSWSSFYFYNRNEQFYPRFAESLTQLSTSNTNLYYNQKQVYVPVLQFDKFDFYGFNFGNFQYTFNRYKREAARKLAPVAAVKGKIAGRVLDEFGDPLFGVTVTGNGVGSRETTDFDGNFAINAKIGETLSFSFIGYENVLVKVTKSVLDMITMSSSLNSLNSVVIVGYSSRNGGDDERVSKNAYATAVFAENESEPVADALSGQVAGIQVLSKTGQPGATANVKLRGANSFTGNVEPLYILNGEIITAAAFKEINESNIVELAILKDAAATAVYGNRGANGVIIISTVAGVSANDLVLAAMNFDNVAVRKNLKETAFFLPQLYTDEKGNLNFTFDSPEALTQWRLRLFAHDKKANVAQLEKLIVTQKDLSIVPNAPRFLREGDEVVLSSKLTNLSEAKIAGMATLKLFDGQTMQPIETDLKLQNAVQSFDIDSKGNKAVNWRFTVPQGLGAVTYRVIAKAGNFSDAEENTLPVLTNRMLVNESRVLWVRAGQTASVTMDKLATTTSTSRENHALTFEYTSNPSWYAIKSLPYLMEFEHECSEQTFSRYYANTIAAHILNSSPKVKEVFDSWNKNGTNKSNLERNEELKTIILAHTPWLLEAQNETEQKQRLALLFDLDKTAREKKKTLAKLEENQFSNGAFPWFKGGKASEYITRHIAAGIGHLNKLEVTDGDTPQTNRIYKNAISYIDQEWESRFNNYLSYKNNKDLKDYGYGVDYWHYQYARSFKVVGTSEKSIKVLNDGWNYAFAKAEKEYASQSIYTQLLMALTMHRKGKVSTAKAIIEGLKQTAVVSNDNGMYWKDNSNSWYWYSSDIETQALAIEAFQEVAADLKSVEELKIWLIKNKRTNRWKSTKATADATYALLLQGGKWLDVKEKNDIKWGNVAISDKVMATVAKEAGSGYFKIRLNADEVTPEKATVIVKNKSEVTGYGGLYWQYFEDLDKIAVDDNLPMSVKKQLYKKVNTDSGEKLELLKEGDKLQVGDRVTVRIEIRSNADLDYVHLKDMRASGFEPIDVISQYKYQDGLGYYQSTKDVASHFFFDSLSKGTYVFEYDVRANNAGDFSNGITQLECMYAPEYSSHSQGIRVLITE